MTDPNYQTSAQVAALLGVTRQTVARWIRDGELRAVRIEVGERAIYRIRHADLADFVRRYVRDEW
jgi:excisionase family DNA binding protein